MVQLYLLLGITLFLIPAPYNAYSRIVRRLGFMYVESYVESERGDDYFEQNKKLGTPSSSWPEGIKLTNNISPSGSTKIPRLFYQVNSSAVQIKRQQVRTFVWQGDDLTILFNITSIQSPLCTRLTPPLSWISASGCKVRLLHRSAQGVSAPDRSGSSDDTGENSLRTYSEEKTDDSQEKLTLVPSSSTVEIVASRSLVENTLSCLRMKGFQREDLFRLLDKGPWILAFDVRPIIPRLFHDLQHDLKLSESQAVHIISHCPYLIAQYFKYKGRDVYATARALFEAGYSQARFTEDIMRFPSMLAAPPDRIRGWQALLQGYNVATTPGIFGKLLRRAPFMFYVNPPGLDDVDKSMVPEDATATASGYVAYGALRILDLIRSLGTSDMDKVVRTQPLILLDSSEEVMRRIGFLLNLFLEDQGPLQWSDGEAGSWNRLLAGGEEGRSAQEQLSSVVLTYPAILSISYEQMRAAANALRENGLKRREVIYLSKRYPPLLSRSSTDIKNALTFFRYQCGLQKDDVMPFISRYPAVLGLAVTDLQAKVTYLYQSLGGTPGMVKKFPAFFSFDLDTHIRPRAEFLRALGIDPLGNGLSFLLTTSVSEFTKAAGVKSQLFNEFQLAYLERWKRKKILEKGSADFANLRSAPLRIVPIEPAISTKSAKPTGGSTVEVVLDELDFGF